MSTEITRESALAEIDIEIQHLETFLKLGQECGFLYDLIQVTSKNYFFCVIEECIEFLKKIRKLILQ